MEHEVILAATITLLILVMIIILLFGIFQTRKNQYIQAEKQFEEEIAKSQMEIQEQALKNIGWELHDNIGQLLSIARMQLNILHGKLPEACKGDAAVISDLVGDTLKEIRLLSRTLNPETIHQMGLVRAIELELERFNKLNFLQASLSITGEEQAVEHKDEIIIFRILQEFFANVIKHSKAQSLKVTLDYLPEKLRVTAMDDGVGFDHNRVVKGSGLMNMKSRAELIGAEYDIASAHEKGVKLSLEYRLKKI